ncbi:MAG: ABC transporter ATP-binding protein/permease [Xanthobacteraceae bacterium]|nr:ABC transporter ATP-binding protein/permease [Xanthobacteraceae bacterium]
MRSRLNQYRTFLAICWKHIGEEKKLFVTFIVISALGALTEGIGIGLFVPLLDSVSNAPNFGNIPILSQMSDAFSHISAETRIKIVALLMLAVVALRSALQFLTQYLQVYLPAKIEQHVRNLSFDYLLHLDMSVINKSRLGGIQNFVSGYPSRIGQVMGFLGSLISNVALLTIYTAMMMLISVKLTLLSIAFMGGVFYLQRAVSSGPLKRTGADVTRAGENLGQVVGEAVGGMSLIRLSVAEERISKRHKEATALLKSAQRRFGFANALIIPLFIATSGALICVMLFAASGGADGGAGSVASVLLLLFLLQRLLTPVSAITYSRNAILLHLDAVFDYEEWVDRARRMRQKDGDIQFHELRDGIRFNSVTFSYETESGDVLREASFFIPKGKMTAIVGPSGAGKSTIVALLGRLYHPQTGAIEVDGVDLRKLKLETWRRTMSVVSQSIFLVNDTVERNLTYSLNRTASPEEIRIATETAACADFIASLPNGAQTQLGERGTRLSGGQQQRLAIARAILVNPQLMIMDEATSSLDSITEHAVQGAMATFGRKRTMVVIAHRLATIKRADNIIVVDNGQVIEQGRHDELLRARGRYCEMIEHQRLDIVDVPEELVETAPSAELDRSGVS